MLSKLFSKLFLPTIPTINGIFTLYLPNTNFVPHYIVMDIKKQVYEILDKDKRLKTKVNNFGRILVYYRSLDLVDPTKMSIIFHYDDGILYNIDMPSDKIVWDRQVKIKNLIG